MTGPHRPDQNINEASDRTPIDTPDEIEVGAKDSAGTEALRVGSVVELVDRGERIVKSFGEHEILVLAVRSELYAVANLCTHGEIWLDFGDVFEDTLEIECPFHAGRFSLATGEATKLPCEIALPTYSVIVRGEDVYVLVPQS